MTMPGRSGLVDHHLPYKCPKCGDSMSFPNLQLLRQHLEVEHTYHSPLIRNFDIYGNKYRSTVAVTPQLAKYTNEAKELERQLLVAKEAELLHKQQWEKVKYTLDQPSFQHSPKFKEPLLTNINHRESDISQPSVLHREDLSYPAIHQSGVFGNDQTSRYNGYLSGNEGPDKSLWTHTNKEISDLSHTVDRLKEQLQFKDVQMKKASDELQKLTEDRRNLQRQVLDLSKEHENSINVASQMEKQIEEKDKLILHKQNELTSMSTFMNDLSTKETTARQRLEDYVNVLLDRTERAETQLQRSQNTTLSRPPSFMGTRTLTSDYEGRSDLRSDWNNLSGLIRHSTPRVNDISLKPFSTVPEPWTSTPHQTTYQPSAQLTENTFTQPSVINPPDAAGDDMIRRQLISGASPSGFSNYSVGEVVSTKSPLASGSANHDTKPKVMSVEDRRPPKNDSASYPDSAIGTNDSSIPNTERHHGRSRSSSSQNPNSPTSKPRNVLNNNYAHMQQLKHYENGPILNLNEHVASNGKQSSVPLDSTTGNMQILEQQKEWLTKQLKTIEVQERLIKNSPCSDHLTPGHRENSALVESDYDDDYSDDSDSELETQSDLTDTRGPCTIDGDIEKSGACSIGEVHLSLGPKAHTFSNQNELAFSTMNQVSKRHQDALYCIFMYLDMKTLSYIGSICKEWLKVSREPSLWRNVTLVNSRISSKYLCTISSWCTELQILHLSGLKPRAMKLRDNRQDYERSIRGCLEAGLEQLFKAARDTLVSLKIVDCGEILTDRCLWLASCHCPRLERVAYVSETDPAGTEVIYSLGAGCRNITTLIVHPQFPNYKPHKFNNKTVQKIVQSWPDMRVLCIGGVDVNAKGLSLLGLHCQQLEVLELDHMCEINEETAMTVCEVGLKQLHTLEFTFTPVTPKAIVYYKNACPKLKTINICIGISDYFEDTTNPVHRENYQEIVYKLKNLRKRPELKGVLHISSDYG